MRGTPVRGRSAVKEMGIIPAYAGNTQAFVDDFGLNRDHPRVCGEHPVTTPDSDTVAGSSPRMRGTQCP